MENVSEVYEDVDIKSWSEKIRQENIIYFEVKIEATEKIINGIDINTCSMAQALYYAQLHHNLKRYKRKLEILLK